jgi:predicted phosphoserine aminotransferase
MNRQNRIDFFLPGPTWVRNDVLQAMTGPMMGHRSPGFKKLYDSLAPRLQEVFRTRGDVMVATGSATLIMESAVVSTVQGKVLNLTCGAFSERWHAISKAVGKEADRIEVPWGQAIDPDLVRQALRRARYEAVTTVHSETSTGVLNPIAEIARVVREESDALVLVDTVSSLGGARVEVDEWGLDIVLASTQKALAVPPGLTLFSLSERAVERAADVRHRGFYTDLVRYRDQHRKSGTVTTPALPVLYGLDRQLDVMLEEGMEVRWERHLGLQAMTAKWARARGYTYASQEGARSPTISCLRPPSGSSAPELVSALAERGVVVGGGYGPWKPETFRIGHMGEVRGRDLEALFQIIDDIAPAE